MSVLQTGSQKRRWLPELEMNTFPHRNTVIDVEWVYNLWNYGLESPCQSQVDFLKLISWVPLLISLQALSHFTSCLVKILFQPFQRHLPQLPALPHVFLNHLSFSRVHLKAVQSYSIWDPALCYGFLCGEHGGLWDGKYDFDVKERKLLLWIAKEYAFPERSRRCRLTG